MISQLNELCNKIILMDEKINIIKKNLQKIIKSYNIKNNYKKGQQCSINGKKYEIIIHNIVSKCLINNYNFNFQDKSELGGSSSKNDLICLFNNKKIGIEVKKYNTPDWMQCSLKYNNLLKRYEGSKKGKIPIQSRIIFNNLIKDLIIFDNIIPPFINNNLTYNEWINIKKKLIYLMIFISIFQMIQYNAYIVKKDVIIFKLVMSLDYIILVMIFVILEFHYLK